MTPLLRDRDGHIETWTMNLPDQRNPITGDDMVAAFVAATEAANADPELRAVILTGAGPAFSSGGNVKDMLEGRSYFGADPAGVLQGYRHGIQRLTRAVYACEVPIIAAVNGPAIGAGCDLATLCDVRVASTSARFAESFVKLGLIPGDGGAWLLPRIVGHARASEMALTGASIDAQRALEWGLVSRVVEPHQLLTTARDLAREIASNPPVAVRLTKRLLREAHRQSLEQVLEASASMQAVCHHTADHRAAVAAMFSDGPAEFHAK